MRNASILAAVFVLAGCITDPNPQKAGPSAEAIRGRAYAEETCHGCHAIEAGDVISPNPQAPAFQTIADTPGMTRIALGAWLHSAHENMPQLMIDQDRADDLWAYLSSLETRPTD